VTLGAPALAGEEPVPLQPLQLGLLAYLAVGGPRDRSHLASLFWHRSSNGLNSLSTTLSRIRSMAPQAIWVQGNALVGSDLPTDVDEIERAAADRDTDRLLELYASPFLSLLSLRSYSIEFEEWMLDRRAKLAADVELALLAGARADLEAGALQTAADLAEAAWVIVSRDGIISPGYLPGYYRILSSADRSLAREVRREADDLGVDLPQVAPALASVSMPAAGAVDRTATALPDLSESTIFGCAAERDAIRASVESSSLTTLVGLGGSGKTSLAADYFASPAAADHFAIRHWVDLSAIDDADLFESSVAAACGKAIAPSEELSDLFDGNVRTLLVLDNFEQIIDARTSVDALVGRCPNVHVLVTSRLPLRAAHESLIQLHGLSLDAATDDPSSGSPAEQLFRAAARRSGAVVDVSDGQAVLEICSLVGGLPLALELAGSWTSVMPPANVADALRSSSGLLDAAPAARQRSMEAIVGEAVGALDDKQRRAINQLATFPGGCTMTAAASLPGLSMRGIGELISRSMVIVSLDDNRLKLHPLLAQHALDRIEGDDESGYAQRSIQVEWCRRYVADAIAAGSTSARTNALSYLVAELVNIEAAWRWSAAQQRWDFIDESLEDLREFFVVSARVLEGQKLFQSVLAAAEEASAPADLVVRLLEASAWLTLMAGQVARARSMLMRASSMTVDVADDIRATVLRTLGVLEFGGGNVDDAITSFEHAQKLIEQTRPSVLMGKLQEDMGVCHHALGRFDEARIAFRSLLDLGREIDDHHMVASGYMRLASLEQEARPHRALVLLEEGHAIARKHNLDHLAIYFPLYAGEAHLSLGDLASASLSFREGLAASDRVGHRMSVAASHIGLAESLLSSDPDAAVEHLVSGIRVSVETNCAPYLMWAAYVAAALRLSGGSTNPLAADMLQLAAGHATTEPAVRGRAAAALDRFAIAAGPAAGESGGDADADSESDARLDEIAEQLLELLRFG